MLLLGVKSIKTPKSAKHLQTYVSCNFTTKEQSCVNFFRVSSPQRSIMLTPFTMMEAGNKDFLGCIIREVPLIYFTSLTESSSEWALAMKTHQLEF